jgi:DNA-directed RNA polymerase subunit omega
MARITVEDCLAKVPDRFALVHIASTRVRQLSEGMPLKIEAPDNKDIVLSLREIAAGKVAFKDSSVMETKD